MLKGTLDIAPRKGIRVSLGRDSSTESGTSKLGLVSAKCLQNSNYNLKKSFYLGRNSAEFRRAELGRVISAESRPNFSTMICMRTQIII